MKVPVPFSSYESTRLTADVQRRVNVYPNSQRGVKQYPGLVDFSTFTALSLKNSNTTGWEQSTWVFAGWNGDGTKLIHGASARLHGYTASTAYDITSVTFDSNDIADYTASLGGTLNNDGTKYIMIRSDGKMYSRNLSTAYDASTLSASDDATFDSSGTLSVSGSGHRYCDFTQSGRKLYVLD